MKKLILAGLLSAIISTVGLSYGEECHHDQTMGEIKKDEKSVNILINLTHIEKGKCLMAINFAKVAKMRGHNVALWLNSEAVKLADAKNKDSKEIKDLINNGIKVYVCPVCSKRYGVKKLVDGAEFSNPDIIFPLLIKEDTKVVGW